MQLKIATNSNDYLCMANINYNKTNKAALKAINKQEYTNCILNLTTILAITARMPKSRQSNNNYSIQPNNSSNKNNNNNIKNSNNNNVSNLIEQMINDVSKIATTTTTAYTTAINIIDNKGDIVFTHLNQTKAAAAAAAASSTHSKCNILNKSSNNSKQTQQTTMTDNNTDKTKTTTLKKLNAGNDAQTTAECKQEPTMALSILLACPRGSPASHNKQLQPKNNKACCWQTTTKELPTNESENCLLRHASKYPIKANAAAATTTAVPENKFITQVIADNSYYRTAEPATLKEQTAQCELLENQAIVEFHLEQKPETAKDLLQAALTLSQRKALLKQEFFKDFCKTEKDLQPAAGSKKNLTKRLLKKQHNLKLKIPKDCKEQQQQQQSSLVALRKLDLLAKAKPAAHTAAAAADSLDLKFPAVKEIAKKFDNMIVPQTKLGSTAEPSSQNKDLLSLKPPLDGMEQRHSPLSDEGCNFHHSPYSSDDGGDDMDDEDDNDSIRTASTAIERYATHASAGNKRKDKVARSASSDSALGLEVDDPMDAAAFGIPEQQQQKRRMTLTVTDLPLRPALLPLAEPTTLPDSPVLDVLPIQMQTAAAPAQIPTKVLLEERVVEIPEDPRSAGSSRRESMLSSLSDYPSGEMQGVRFVRTPSVVVSDYSDDIMCGITLEEIEYFRAQRMQRRRSSLDTANTEKDAADGAASDVSAASSCSNLYYCGSTISALDGAECLVNGRRMPLERKSSDCSTCSVSGDEEAMSGNGSGGANTYCIPEQPEDCQDITDMLAQQHITASGHKRTKKVGGICCDLANAASTAFLTVDKPHLN